MTHLIDCTHGWEPDDLADVTRTIRAGELIVLPTDTVYGIGADATQPQAITRLLAAKGRGRQMPPPVLAATIDQAFNLCVDIPDAARTLAEDHWPGGLTLILTARPDLGWDLGETGGTLAVRIPDHAGTCELLRSTGPLAVTSANLTGQPPATDINQAQEYFGDTVGLYISSGPTQTSTPSTIVDCAHGQPKIIRLGTLTRDDLEKSVGHALPA